MKDKDFNIIKRAIRKIEEKEYLSAILLLTAITDHYKMNKKQNNYIDIDEAIKELEDK